MPPPKIPGTELEVQPKKDRWDKADIIGRVVLAALTAIAAIVIPLAVAWAGWQVQQTVAIQSTGKDYIQIALNILERKDLPVEMQKNVGLRKWAVGLLGHYSDIKLDEDTTEKLIDGETAIPKPEQPTFPWVNPTPHDNWK